MESVNLQHPKMVGGGENGEHGLATGYCPASIQRQTQTCVFHNIMNFENTRPAVSISTSCPELLALSVVMQG
jgi:hypothetical protein